MPGEHHARVAARYQSPRRGTSGTLIMPTDAPIFIYQGHSDHVFAVAWSHDATTIASGSRDKTVRVWNSTTGHNYCIYRGHATYLLSVAWSPDGKYIASGDADGFVHVWEA